MTSVPTLANSDDAYMELILEPIRRSGRYQPKFGSRNGLTLSQFQDRYRADPFYSWFGLDSPMMYAAHKAAGGMTSVYRQIGIGCERVFRQVIKDMLQLSDEDATWSYQATTSAGKTRTLSLDGRAPFNAIANPEARARLDGWTKQVGKLIGIEAGVLKSLTGVVFEVRQGYKSKDSKRQNADIENAATAYISSYLPCAAILSNQIDDDILRRYRAEKWAMLTGVIDCDDPLVSVYDFMREVIGYDLAAFFERNKCVLQAETKHVLSSLLRASD